MQPCLNKVLFGQHTPELDLTESCALLTSGDSTFVSFACSAVHHFVVLGGGVKSRALHMLGKFPPSELHLPFLLNEYFETGFLLQSF